MVHQGFHTAIANSIVPRAQVFQWLFDLGRIKAIECDFLCQDLLFPLVEKATRSWNERALDLLARAK